MTQFGRALRPLWGLASDAAFLNHGSFGACPLEVLKAQDSLRARMESHLDSFFFGEIMPQTGRVSMLRAAAAEMTAFINVPADNFAFVENASSGIQAVMRSLAFAPGDQILVTDHTYNAMRLMVDTKCAETGASVVVVKIPLPATGDEIVARFAAAITPAVKFAIVDHITSPTALLMPVERIIPLLKINGTRALIDGAHAVGQLALDVTALGADWYVSNFHKWLFAPKGSAFLYASAEVAPFTQPNLISHFVAMGFPRSFEYVGTRDNTAWLATPAALKFFQRLGPASVRDYQRQLIALASALLVALGAVPVSGLEMCAAMRAFILPQARAAKPEDAEPVLRSLWEQARIQTRPLVFGDKLILRLSAQVYVDEHDISRLADALNRLGWPGR